MADGLSPIWDNVPSDRSSNVIVNKEPHGATYDMVASNKSGVGEDSQSVHWLGQLLPPAVPNRDAPRSQAFWDGVSIFGQD